MNLKVSSSLSSWIYSSFNRTVLIDAHEYVPEAKEKAAANNIKLAISNPCFELWLLLHFQEQSAHIERHQVQSACRGHVAGYVKDVPFQEVFPHYPQAVRRAAALEHWQETRGCAGENPSTGGYRLTERIVALGREAQLKNHGSTAR